MGQDGWRRLEVRFSVEAVMAAFESVYNFMLPDYGGIDA